MRFGKSEKTWQKPWIATIFVSALREDFFFKAKT